MYAENLFQWGKIRTLTWKLFHPFLFLFYAILQKRMGIILSDNVTCCVPCMLLLDSVLKESCPASQVPLSTYDARAVKLVCYRKVNFLSLVWEFYWKVNNLLLPLCRNVCGDGYLCCLA